MAVAADTRSRIKQTMLIQQNWLLLTFKIVLLCICASWTIYSEHAVNVVICGVVVVLLKWIVEISNNLVKILVLVFVEAYFLLERLNVLFRLLYVVV